MAEIVTFGSWLKQARRQLDLTQKELAFHSGCSVGTIRKIEADERQPSRQLARLMAENLHIPPEKHDAFIAFARSEPHIDHISFSTLTPEVGVLDIPAAAAQESFGDLVRSRRSQLGLNRKGLAALIGCTSITICQIERNERRPSLELAELLAAHLNIPDSQYEQFIFAARGEFVPRYGYLTEISLAEAQAPAAEEEAPQHNLPLQTTPFFGRRREMAEITSRLGDPHCRLLTILAAGGMGKTRLSIEAASAQIGSFTDGVIYVALVPISPAASEEAVSPLLVALANTLNFSFHGSDTPKRQLFAYLRRREILLVLDNFEHVLDKAELVGDLLQNAPDIKILITSRERLNLQEEWLFPLLGLSAQEAANSEAAQLFSQRAQQVQASFDLEAELDEVLRICQLVEGMPLALELAAAWVLQLSCAEIAAEIEAEIDFLTTRSRNVPERHRSMRAVFGTSWEKLSRNEKDVLQKATVFRGGFDRKAAQAVAGASLYILSDLVSKSFLSVTENGRYAIHELLRQFAAEKLAEQGSLAQEVQASHGRYFLTFVAGKNLDEPAAALEGSQNLDNVRAAIRWTVRHQPHSFDHALAYKLWFLFELSGWLLEAETTFRMIVDQLLPDCIDPLIPENKEAQQSCLRVAAYQLAVGKSQWRQNRLQEAEESAQLALQWLPVADELDFQALRAESIFYLGFIRFSQGALVEALTYYQQAGDLYQAVDDQTSYGWTLFNQNVVMQNTGEFDAAEEHQNSFQQIAAQMDDLGLARHKWNELGKLATIRGQLDEAEAYFDKSLEQFAEANYLPLVAYVLRERGEVSRLKGDYAEAINYAQRSIALAEDIHMPHPIILSLWLLGNVAVDEEHYETALHYFAEYEQISTPLQEQIGGPGWALLGLGRLAEAREKFAAIMQNMIDNQARPIGLDALVGMAHIKTRTGQLEEALTILALVQNHQSSHFESREKAYKLWEELAIELPAGLITAAETRGREMDLMRTAESLLAEAATAKLPIDIVGILNN